jgi:competence ComEA-like helix-hairpin-helix protein
MYQLNHSERRALLLGTALLVLGGAVRVGLGPGPATFGWESRDEASGGVSGRAGTGAPESASARVPGLDGLRGDVERNLARARRAATPLGPGERIDLNRAPADELERLPGIGPVTARRIVSERERSGGFSRPEELERVPGIGPRRVRSLLPYLLDHSRPYFQRGSHTAPGAAGRVAEERRPPSPPPSDRRGSAGTDGRRLDINRASEEELRRLPGIGPAIARRILRRREREGPFRDIEELRKVPGIGPARFDLLRELVRVR